MLKWQLLGSDRNLRIKYPENMFCPSCKNEIKLDYSDKRFASTEDLLIMNIMIPESYKSAQDAMSNKQDIRSALPKVLLCQRCHTILGIYDFKL